ncbi:MAG: ankyrin repeat domain-containing protein, partial [Alphaproteobacteria bacterium]|nr:ankyrin repeat domain-containing protein [Alphaproteobacteria bacterium]
DLISSSTDFSIDNLKLLKSIYEASSTEAQQSKQKTQSEVQEKLKESKTGLSETRVQTTPQNQPDPNTCYQLALDEIKNNPNPGELFEMYLEAIKKDSSKLTDENSVRNLSHFAAMTGKSSFIAPLIKHLPDSFSVKDHNEINADNTPLMLSIANDKNQFAFDLLTQTQAPKVDIDINHIFEQYGINALHLAVAKDYDDKDSQSNQVGIANHQLVKKLIDCDADPNIQTTKSGLSALDIAVLRGSETMVSAILESKKINSSTILKAIEDIDEPKDDSGSGLCQWFPASQTSTQIQTPKEEATKKLQQICGGDLFKQLEDGDFSDTKKTNIKELLENKLQELDSFYKDKKNLKELIKKYVESIITSSGESNFGPSIQFKDQDKNFLCFSKPSSEIVKFYPILHRDRDKFNYNKKLDNSATYDPEDFTKEKEQEKILNLLIEAKKITSRNFNTLDDNFFIAVMKVASENRGIASITDKKTFNESYKKALDELGSNTLTTTNVSQDQDLHEIAKFFSAQFQELSGKQKYLTGRDSINGEINQTPRRLFRVCTDENIEKFKESLFEIVAPSSSPSTPSTPKSIREDATPDRI